MNISCEPRSIRILSSNGNRLATASITIDGAFVVRNLSLMNGSKGMFVNMPQQKGVDDKGNTKYYDIAFPLTAELRTAISEAVIGAYKERQKQAHFQGIPGKGSSKRKGTYAQGKSAGHNRRGIC